MIRMLQDKKWAASRTLSRINNIAAPMIRASKAAQPAIGAAARSVQPFTKSGEQAVPFVPPLSNATVSCKLENGSVSPHAPAETIARKNVATIGARYMTDLGHLAMNFDIVS